MTATASKKNRTSKHASKGAPLALLEHQVEALERTEKRLLNARSVYWGLDPGLGKTVLACAFRLKHEGTMLYISPPGLVSNVEAEFKRFAPGTKVQVVPDTKLGSVETKGIEFDYLFVDEAQRFINTKSQRSRAFSRIAKHEKKVVLMSGSPSPNSRPIELWPILEHFAPEVFGMSFFEFAKRYCGAEQVQIGWNPMLRKPILKWKFDGFTNKQEFKQRLYKSFMIRMRKDKLNLPPKIEGILTVGDNMPPMLSKLESKILAKFEDAPDTAKEWLEGLAGVDDLHQSRYLKLLGEHKLQYVFPYLDRLMTDTQEKVLLFAKHQDVILGLEKHLAQYQPLVLNGKTPIKARKGLVEEFQTNPNRRVFILNIEAGGIGWTLTEADRVLFIEQSWRDGDNGQASDRAHRIGRTKPLLVQYVVLKDSIDARRMGVVLNKRRDAV